MVTKTILLGVLMFMSSICAWPIKEKKPSATFNFTIETSSENLQQSVLVKKIGKDLLESADRYLNANGYPGFMKDFKWDFNLVKNELAISTNDPKDKIVVSTGMMELAQNANGLAVIISHMMAHSLAEHGENRKKAAQLQEEEKANNSHLNDSAEALVQKESEADRIGLTLMAIAGYDPDEAAKVWERVEKSDMEISSEFLNMHPVIESRINNLKDWAPKAKAEARKFGVTNF
jgi:predicted Zn-dependent protease